jgi:hypothetical protein
MGAKFTTELFKELARSEEYIDRLKMQLERQSQTIRDQAEIIENLRRELDDATHSH